MDFHDSQKGEIWFLDSDYNNYIEVDEDQELLLMGQVDFHDSQKGVMWFLDSCYNNHMIGDKKWFLHLDETLKHVVKLDNTTKMLVMGKVSIKMRVNDTCEVITEVYYLPKL